MSKSSKKLIKRIFWSLSALILVIIISGVSLAYVYEAEVKQYAIEKINDQINSKIKVEKIEFSFLRRFPMASLQFHNVEILEAVEKGKAGSLFTADDIFLKFDIINLLQNKIVLKNVEINGSKLNLTVFKDGSDNFHFLKKQKQSQSSYLLQYITLSLNDANIWYRNYATKQEMDFVIHKSSLSGIFAEEKFDVNILSDVFIERYVSEGYQMFSKKNLTTDMNIVINPQTKKFGVKKGDISFNNIPFSVSGNIEKPKEGLMLDLKIEANALSLKQILNTIPETYRTRLEDYKFQGLLSIKSDIKGLIVSRSTPHIKVQVLLQNADIESRSFAAKMTHFNMEAIYTNGRKHSLSSSSVNIKNLSFDMNGSHFSTKVQLSNFVNSKLKAEIGGDLDLKELLKFTGNIFGIQKLEGKANLRLKIAGNMTGLVGESKLDLSGIDYQASLKMNGVSFKHNSSNAYYQNIVGRISFNANDIHIDPTWLTVNGHRHKVEGDVKNYRKWSQDSENNKLYIRATVDASQLSYHDIEQILGDSDGGDGRFPNDIDLVLNFRADSFYWDNILAQKASGSLSLQNRMLNFQRIKLQAFGGNVAAQLTLGGTNAKQHPMFCKGNLDNVNISQVFEAFQGFGQQVISSDNIKGKVTSALTFNALFNKNWEFDKPSFVLDSKIKIVNGELNNIKELDALSKYTSIDDFSHIVFSTLENNIQVQNQLITIPDMLVKSNKMDIDLTGTHGFDNSYDYHLGVLMSEVLFKRAKQKSKNEFGEVENDGYGRTKLFFHVYGKGDDLHVKYDSKGLKKKLKQDMKEEGEDLKKTLNKEFGWFKESQESSKKDSISQAKEKAQKKAKSDLKKQEEGSFIFEWDESEEEDGDTLDF